MKTCSKCREVKPQLDFGKNKRTKDGLNCYCRPCARLIAKPIEATRRAKEKALGLYRSVEWAKANRDKANELHRHWRNNNQDKANAHDAARRAARINATPCWLSVEQRQQIVALYTQARRLTQSTGVRWVVDHIVPLRGRGVRGLHVPWNLRVITEAENLHKGNKYY